jgi:hypothetical protein
MEENKRYYINKLTGEFIAIPLEIDNKLRSGECVEDAITWHEFVDPTEDNGGNVLSINMVVYSVLLYDYMYNLIELPHSKAMEILYAK